MISDLEQFHATSRSRGSAKKVYGTLRTKSELKRMMEGYAVDDDHEPKTSSSCLMSNCIIIDKSNNREGSIIT